MTYTTPDGIVIEFTDSQIRQYCKIREIEVVPLRQETEWGTFMCDAIIKSAQTEIEMMCLLNDEKVPRE